ncbi:MAG: ATPase, partial [Mucilaginibacter sp.]|nr:ATPase [Mucilaginibacter sp.]
TYNSPVNKVWEALTDNDKIKEWYFQLDDFKAEVGFTFRFSGSDKGVTFWHECIVQEVVPFKKLSYTWRYVEYPGDSLVSIELFDEGDKTRLKLTHSGLESFPADNPSFAKESFAKGWTYITGTGLKNYLEK